MTNYVFRCPDCKDRVEFIYSPIDVPFRMTGPGSASETPVKSVYLTCKNQHVHKYNLADAEEK